MYLHLLTSIEIEHSMSDIGDWFAVFSTNKNKNKREIAMVSRSAICYENSPFWHKNL